MYFILKTYYLLVTKFRYFTLLRDILDQRILFVHLEKCK